MAPLPTLYLRQSMAQVSDPLEGQDRLAVAGESAVNRPYSLEPRQFSSVYGLDEIGVPSPHHFGDSAGGPDLSSTPPYQPPPGGPEPGYAPGPDSAPRPPPGSDSIPGPAPMHDPSVDLTPGSVPMGEVGPPGPSFFSEHKTKFMIAGGVIVVAVIGFFVFKFIKKKRAAAAAEEGGE